MMPVPTWNYRVKRKPVQSIDAEYEYSIVEVTYDGNGNIDGCGTPALPWGRSVVELRLDIELMSKAFSRPVIEEIGGEYVEVE